MLSPVRLSSVCLSSVTFVRPTQAVEIFGNISTAFGSLAIHWHPPKIFSEIVRGTPPPGKLNTRGVVKYSDFGPISTAISRKRCKIGGKLVLITNRKSYMTFRLVPKSVTLNDLEWRNGRYFALFQRIFMYDVAVKQLLGLHRFQNLLLILDNHIKPICAIIQRLFGQIEVITGFDGCTWIDYWLFA